MDRSEAITVLESLANGIDPGTGALIPHDAFHTANTVRALFTAVSLLKDERPGPRRRAVAGTTTLTSAGMPWNEEEDAQLSREFDAGLTTSQIALQHGRSSGAITSRLVKLGRIDPATVKSRDRGARVAS